MFFYSAHTLKRRRLAALGGGSFFRLAIQANLGPPEGREFRHESRTFSARWGVQVVISAVCFSNKVLRR